MKIEYEQPEVLVLLITPADVINTSSLENPGDGGEWGWD